jgi:peptide/nickel transport system permease protein
MILANMPMFYLHNLVAIIILLIFVSFTTYILKHPFWGIRVKRSFKGIYSKVGLAIAILFFATAWLDSISWRDTVAEDNKEGLQASKPRSLLDRTFSKFIGMEEYKYRESTHSAPLSTHEFYNSDEKLKFKHLLGTDISGYDTLYLIIKGIRPAVIIGTVPLLITLPLAIFFGILAGYHGGKLDEIVVYVYTVLSSIPSLLLLIVVIAALEKSMLNICIALGITSWVALCRLVRAETFKLRELEYIQAAKCLGGSTYKIILKHIMPNLTHIILITSILTFTGLVLSESILAYLGMGLTASWGTMIATAKNEIAQDPVVWWNLLFSSSMLFLLVLSVNIVGDSLRDALDPRTNAE